MNDFTYGTFSLFEFNRNDAAFYLKAENLFDEIGTSLK